MLKYVRRVFGKESELAERVPEVVSPASAPEAAALSNVEHYIDRFWCDQYGMFFQGWIHAHDEPVLKLKIDIGEDATEFTEFSERPDLLEFFPGKPAVVNSGFSVFAPGRPGEPAKFTVVTERGETVVPVILPRLELPKEPEASGASFKKFIDTVNEEHLTVLEIGSRMVGDESSNYREFFPGAARFIGTDIHPSPTVDQVADAHNLSKDIGEEAVDAIFSLSVLEHLPFPWLAALEMNRSLKAGGLVFHSTPQSWPLHEMPNDFWRFSDEALKLLFGPEMGFEVLAVEMINPVVIHPAERSGGFANLPLNPGWGNAMILARKVRHLPADAVVWPANAAAAGLRSEEYPKADRGEG